MKTLEEEVTDDEGLSLKLYKDSLGVPTIGYGRNLVDLGISLDEAKYLRNNDCARARAEADKLSWFVQLDEVRQLVVLSMIFQLGLHRFLGFYKTIAALEAGDYLGASQEMLNSFWARQTPNRAKKLSNWMMSGTLS